ncbi:hypothetical protein C9374_007147 [Naegleria lovaniensis]|uniref:6-phosphogluconolactonase n=1 Tax=Naegleria lovaniensis TaxID=51637 RepID=A0AA88H4H7_NAELO|nr:uncharacterized protein C9374_013790 [Naegleria lovaniensis]XP_044555510.1 uncharacterized protein C9374_007147 [Naegleria lovaniensis]KAG2370834.1 hypothetical protein C9374_013790 [Naegleria lovaniensis]KAG2393616.1 hypothetical protein C9374_007147 [Naegleria lovaniensis]
MSKLAYRHHPLTNPNEFNTQCAQAIMDRIQNALNKHSRAMIGLSGGSTPIPIYKILSELLKPLLPNKNIIFFLMDDRYVPMDHADSNQKLVLDSLNVTQDQVTLLFPNSQLPIDECVKDYQERLQRELEKQPNQRVTLSTLGMGPDGHTCSIFPATTKNSDIFCDEFKVVHTTTTQFAVFDRITVNYHFLLNQSEELFMFFRGKDKWHLWKEMEQFILEKRNGSAHDTNDWLKYPCLPFLCMDNCVLFSSD